MNAKMCAIFMRMAITLTTAAVSLPGAAGFALPGAGAAFADCPPQYEVETIIYGPEYGEGDFAPVTPWGISENGFVTGDYGYSSGTFAWYGEDPIVPLHPPPTFSTGAEDINSDGLVAGYASFQDNDFGALAAVFDGEGVVTLGVLPGANSSFAMAINDAGEVVGYSGHNVTGDPPWQAFLWRDGEMINLGEGMGAINSRAYDISPSGEVAGRRIMEEDGENIAFLWDDGVVVDLGPIPGGISSQGRAINGHREVAGNGVVWDGTETTRHAFFWRDGQMLDLGTLPTYKESTAYDLNDDSYVVGYCSDSDFLYSTAFLWVDGTMWDLNKLIPKYSGVILRSARGINNSGRILAEAKDEEGNTVAVILKPVEIAPTDLNGDCYTDVLDLLLLLGEWGASDSDADFNHDGVVDVIDLLFLLGAWNQQGSIQAAINNAVDGDEIVIAPGTYHENIDMRGKAITLRSQNPDDPEIVASTVIDGAVYGSIITCSTLEGPDTIISGFTITNGRAPNGAGLDLYCASPTVINCVFSGNQAEEYGGGVYCDHLSDPTFIGCTFNRNEADTGGGIYGYGGCDLTLTDCTFTENSATAAGAIYSIFADLIATGCLFNANTAEETGGGVSSDYGYLLAFTDCVFLGNSSDWGGGMFSYENRSVELTNCTFIDNSAESNGGAMAGFYNNSTTANCVFIKNSAGRGGGIFNGYDAPWESPTIINCTFSGNEADEGAAIFNKDLHEAIVTNCILWGDIGGEIANEDSDPIVTYCNIQGGYEGEGNIDADPLFTNADEGDFRLSPGSPCIDAANNLAVPEDIVTDLDGNPRFVDDPDTQDTGLGEPPVVDMGAYEFQAGWFLRCVDRYGCADTRDAFETLWKRQ